MDIHHAMMVRNNPLRVYEALTRAEDLAVWMAAPAIIEPAGTVGAGAVIEFRYGQGPKPEHVQRSLRVQIMELDAGKLVRWRITQPVWPLEKASEEQVVTWTLTAYEGSTLVDLHMDGWTQGEDAYASVSYKWATFMLRLKIYMGDVREIADMLEIIEKKVSEKRAEGG